MRNLFDGPSINKQDEKRLLTLYSRVFNVMENGNWHTLPELQKKCGGSEAGISARIRDMRKSVFGGHTIERRRAGNGFWEYKLIKKD